MNNTNTPMTDALMARWSDDGASRGAAFIELRDLARKLEQQSTMWQSLQESAIADRDSKRDERDALLSANQAMQPTGDWNAELLDWLEVELSAIDTWYRGSPSYEHDAGWFKDKALKLISEARKAFKLPESLKRQPSEASEPIHLSEYDAGHLNDFGGGNVGWWWDYIRYELGCAHEFYQSQVDNFSRSAPAATNVSEIDELRAEVKEWLCDACNTVYPGPPQKGFACVICPLCQGNTGPRNVVEIRKLRAALVATAQAQPVDGEAGGRIDLANIRGTVLGSGYPDWPDDLTTFKERQAYQLGVAHARALSAPSEPKERDLIDDIVYKAWLKVGADLRGLDWHQFVAEIDAARSAKEDAK